MSDCGRVSWLARLLVHRVKAEMFLHVVLILPRGHIRGGGSGPTLVCFLLERAVEPSHKGPEVKQIEARAEPTD